MSGRLSPSRLAFAYVAVSLLALALFAIPLWYGWQANYGTFRAYVPGEELQRIVDTFQREGPAAAAAAVQARVARAPADEIVVLAGPAKEVLAGNLAAWPAEVPAQAGTYGVGIATGGDASLRVVAAHVTLAGGYRLLMGRESVRFASLVERFWYGVAAAMIVFLALGATLAWLLRRRQTDHLRESEARFRSLTELSSDFFWETDAEHRYTSIELGWAYAGVRNNESKLGRTRWEIPYASPDEAAWAAHRAAILARERFVFCFSRLEEGEERFYEHSGEPRYDTRGNFRGYRGVGRDVTARKRAEDELRESEARFRGLTELWSDWYWRQDEHLRFTYSSAATGPPDGYPGGSPIGKTRWELPGILPLSGSWAEHQQVLAAREPFREFEYSRPAGDGTLRYISTSGTPIFDEKGRFRGYQGVARNITGRKRADEALRQSEDRYMRAMAAAQAGFWDWDVTRDAYYVSPRLLEMAGLPSDTVIAGREDFQARVPLQPEDLARWQNEIKALFAGGGSRLSTELRVILDAQTRWYRVDGMCFRDAAGAVVRWTGSAIDVTELKRVEEALRLSDERYARVIQASEDGFWEWVVATDEFYASPRMLAIYGLPPNTVFRGRAEFLSRFPFHPDDFEQWRKSVAAHLAGECARIELEVRVKLQGRTRWLHLSAICQRGASGAEERWTGGVSDVTERRRAQEALQRSEERYARAMEGSDAGHWDWNIVTDEMFVSERAREMMALPKDSAPARRAEIMALVPMHPDDRAAMDQAVSESIRSGTHERDYRVIAAPGETRWLRSRAKVYRDERGAAVRMTGSLIDFTERKLAADALRASEERYGLAVEASEEGFVDVNIDTDEFFTSARLNEIFGLAPDVRFKHRADFLRQIRFHGNDGEIYAREIGAVMAQGGPERYEFEFRILLPSGELRWLRTRGKVTRDAEGRARRRIGVVADITARKLAEEGLRESQEQYARAMEATEAGHWEWDLVTHQVFHSPRFRELYGIGAGEIFVDRDAWKARQPISAAERARQEQALQAAIADPSKSYDIELSFEVRPGEVRWLRSRAKVFRSPEGRALRVTGATTDITAQKLAQEALRRSEERYALAMEAAGDGHTDWNLASGEFYISPRLLGILGYAPGTTFTDRADWVRRFPFHPEDRPRWEAAIAAHFAGTEAKFRMDLRIVVNGETRWVAFTFIATRDAAGKPVRWTGSIADVHDAKLAEQALRASEERYALAVAGASDGIWDEDYTTGMLYRSPRNQEIALGRPSDGIDVRTRAEWAQWHHVHPEDAPKRDAALRAHLEGRTPLYETEYRVLHPDGTYHWILARGLCIRDASGRALRIAGSTTNIDARKAAEEALRESQERYALAVAGSDDGVWDVDFTAQRVFLSARARELTGLPPGPEMVPLHAFTAMLPIHPDDLPRRTAAMQAHLTGEAPAYEGEFRLRQLDGIYRWRRIHGICVRDANGQPQRMAGSFSDVDARRRAEDGLRLSEERYALAMAASEEGHFDWNVRSDEIFASEHLRKLLALPADFEYRTRGEMVARVPFCPGESERVAQNAREVLAGSELQHEFEYRLQHPAAREARWIHARWRIFRDAAGVAQRVIGVISDITERKLAADALAESEARFRVLTGLSSDWYWQQDENLRFSYVSHQGLNATGLPGDTVIGRTRWDFDHIQPLSGSWDEHQAVLAARQPFRDLELIARPPGGPVSYLSISGAPIFGEKGEFRGYHGVARDTSERKRVEEALRQSEERYALAVEGSNEGIFDWDLASDRVYVSYRAQELFGLPRGELWRPRRDWRHILNFYPEDAPRLHDSIKAHIEGGSPTYDVEFRIVLPGGGVRWFRQRGIALRDAGGKAYRVVGSIGDITERKQATETLRVSELRFRTLVQLNTNGFWVQDENLRYVSSQLTSDVAGYDRHGMDGKTRWELSGSPTPLSGSWDEHRAELAARRPFREFEYRRHKPDGSVGYYSASGVPIFDDQGGFKGYYGVANDITERKRAEEELRESEARFRGLVELSSDWYWKQDENLRFVSYVPPEVGMRSGIAAAASLGKQRWEFENIKPLSSSWEEHKAVLAARQPFRDFEYVRVDEHGTPHYTVISGVPNFDSQGRFTGYEGVGTNISERRRFEEELRSRQEMLELAQQSAHAVPWEWRNGADPEVNKWSPELCALFGLPPGGFDGTAKGWWKLCHPDDWPAVTASIARARDTGEIDVEYRVIHPDGSVRWLNQKGRAFLDEDGKPVRSIGFMFDVTERRKVEDELRSRQEMLELAQKSARAIAFEWKIGESEGENRWSPDLEAMYGLAPGTYDGSFERWQKLVHVEDWPAVKDAIGYAQRTGDVDAEYRVVHPDGAVHWLHAKGRMLFDAAGKPSRMVGFMQDVTDRRYAQEEYRRMERQLRQAQRLEAMGTLAGGIAHDFNNILGAILGYGEMALRDAPKGSRLRRDLDSIVVAGERGRALVDRVLAFSRSGVGERVPVHVEKVVREALDLLAAGLPPNVTLHAKLHAGAAAMLGDATQVHQVLMNLATNAIHAMPEGGRLGIHLDAVHVVSPRVAAIGTLAAADYVVLKVTDTGTGIAPGIMERIFDPFFTTKEVGTGTGLGLSLVHGIVTELGGAIDVASTHGAGSVFTVYLPRSGDALDSVEKEESELPRGEGQRVLIVDDEEPLVRLATRTLEELGYTPVGFTSSTAALAAFRADPKRFDALITDERMPGLSGSALIREVRGIRGGIPIVLMSGFVGGAVARQAREAGAEEVLKKPLSARDLAASLARVLHP